MAQMANTIQEDPPSLSCESLSCLRPKKLSTEPLHKPGFGPTRSYPLCGSLGAIWRSAITGQNTA
jgi:hypothetical protein